LSGILREGIEMLHEKRRIQMTVILYIDETNRQILLGRKKRGFGEGRWNGFGGKVKPGETIEKSARRELFEEAKILAGEMERVGKIDFEFMDNPEEILEVYFVKILKYYGEPRETEEMRPQWFEWDSIPYEEMWPDDKYWMSIFLEGKKFEGRILFKDSDTILENGIKAVKMLNQKL